MNKRNILLADNSMDVQEVFQAVFNSDNYDLRISRSSSETLSEVFSKNPDIIILDGDIKETESPEIIRTLRANSRTNSIPVLVILSEDKTEFRKMFASAGNCDFYVKPITPDRIKTEVESLIRGKNLFGAKMNSRIITFCGTRGGCGTTTLAVNTAVSMIGDNRKVILLEHANYFSGIRPALNLQTRKTLPFIMMEDPENITQEQIVKFIETHESGLMTIPTISGIADMEKMDAEAVQFMKFNLCPVGDFAVIDGGYGLNEATLELFDISDMIIFVSTLDIASLYNLELIAQVFEGTRINTDKCQVVFNHIHSAGEIPEATIKELKLKMKTNGFIPNHSVGFLKAWNNGEPYVKLFPKTPSTKAIRGMADKILGSFELPIKQAEVA